MKENASLIILAGGQSKRMGQPKHLLSSPRGRTVMEHLVEKLSPLFTETLVVGRDPLPFTRGIRVVKDVHPVHSPLVGIYSGLLASKTDLTFVVACDMPFVQPPLVARLLAKALTADISVPIINGYYEPLCAAYRRTAIPAIAEAIARDIFKVTSIYEHLRLSTLSEEDVKRFDKDLVSFTNLNVPQQLDLLEQI